MPRTYLCICIFTLQTFNLALQHADLVVGTVQLSLGLDKLSLRLAHGSAIRGGVILA